MPRRASGDRRRGMALPLLWYPRITYRPPEAPDPDLAHLYETVWEPRAPADWPVQLGSLVIDVAVAEVTERLHGKRRVIVGPILGGALGVPWAKLVNAAERRRGKRLGLTPATEPAQRVACLDAAFQTGAWRAIAFFSGRGAASSSWPRIVASRGIAELERRRSWNRALARARETQ